MYLYLTCLGGYRERETPGPIPNPEAKPLIADNTADFICGNVGRCLVCLFYFTYFLKLIHKYKIKLYYLFYLLKFLLFYSIIELSILQDSFTSSIFT